MARDNARLTHAQYDKNDFNNSNDGYLSLPNGADQQFIEGVESLDSIAHAWFFDSGGDVMVRYADDADEEELAALAEKYNMVRGDYETDKITTFVYSPE